MRCEQCENCKMAPFCEILEGMKKIQSPFELLSYLDENFWGVTLENCDKDNVDGELVCDIECVHRERIGK